MKVLSWAKISIGENMELINKIDAEKALLRRSPNAYILRPPYLYGR